MKSPNIFVRVISMICFSHCLRAHGFVVVRVLGWGSFLVEGKGIARKRVTFDWWEGII